MRTPTLPGTESENIPRLSCRRSHGISEFRSPWLLFCCRTACARGRLRLDPALNNAPPAGRGFLVLAAAALLCLGCATREARQAARTAPAPGLRLGPVLELLSLHPPQAEVRIVVDALGRGHVIVASSATEAVHHLVVARDQVLERNILAPLQRSRSIDAAVDRVGTLHVLVGERYFVRAADERWVSSEATPWHDSGLEATRPGFVPGATDLVWAFRIGGPESGAPRRWDWTGILVGGPAAAVPLVWAWPTYGSKLVVVQQKGSGPGAWNVLDHSDKSDSANCRYAASAQGMVHVAYDAARGGLLAESSPRYARFSVRDPEIPLDPPPGVRFRPIQGIPVEGLRRQGMSGGFGSQTALSVDPETGTALILRAHDRSWLVRDGTWSDTGTVPFFASGPWEPRLCPAGEERFHALLLGGSRVFYLQYSERGWSAPVDLGSAHTTSFLGWFGATVQIGGDGHGRALAVWPVKRGLAGRWIELN